VLWVRRALLANGRGRWLAAGVSVIVAGGMLYAQSHEHPPAIAAIAVSPQSVAPAAPYVASPGEAQALAASASAANPGASLALPVGVASEEGLQVKTIWVARAISMMYPEIKTMYGFRQDPLKWHPNGLAIDVMIPNHNSDEGIQLGNQIAGYALANAKTWGVLHVIWRHAIYPGIGTPSWMAEYGNETANHYDHVHIATDGGGYPTGKEIYYLDSMQRAPPS
jgi:hypothetical protein